MPRLEVGSGMPARSWSEPDSPVHDVPLGKPALGRSAGSACQGRQRLVQLFKRATLDRFLPNPVVGTDNVSNRESWLQRTLAALPGGLKILDAGAGELQYERFCPHLDYTSQDVGQYDGKGNHVGLQVQTWDNSRLDITSDIGHIPVENESFDAIMCIEVLEHVPRPIDAIREFARILRPGGNLVITTPVASLTHFAPFYFYNGYSRYFFETVLGDHGFTDITVETNGNFFGLLAQELRRAGDVASTYCPNVKPAGRSYWLAQRTILRRLDVLCQDDTGSNELTSYGLHVTARKAG